MKWPLWPGIGDVCPSPHGTDVGHEKVLFAGSLNGVTGGGDVVAGVELEVFGGNCSPVGDAVSFGVGVVLLAAEATLLAGNRRGGIFDDPGVTTPPWSVAGGAPPTTPRSWLSVRRSASRSRLSRFFSSRRARFLTQSRLLASSVWRSHRADFTTASTVSSLIAERLACSAVGDRDRRRATDLRGIYATPSTPGER